MSSRVRSMHLVRTADAEGRGRARSASRRLPSMCGRSKAGETRCACRPATEPWPRPRLFGVDLAVAPMCPLLQVTTAATGHGATGPCVSFARTLASGPVVLPHYQRLSHVSSPVRQPSARRWTNTRRRSVKSSLPMTTFASSRAVEGESFRHLRRRSESAQGLPHRQRPAGRGRSTASRGTRASQQ